MYIKQQKPYLITFAKTEKRVENTTLSGVFLTIFQLFGNVVEHYLGCNITNNKFTERLW